MQGKYNKKVSEAQICKFYFFSFERKCLITSSLVIFKYCSFFRMIICSSNMSDPNLFFFAAVAIPQSEKHRSDGVRPCVRWCHTSSGDRSDRRLRSLRCPEEVKNNGRLMWTAEETAGSKDLRSVYGPLPGPDRLQICGLTEDRRHH